MAPYWLIAFIPPLALTVAFHIFAARNGRPYRWMMVVSTKNVPLVDQRLNDAYKVVKWFAIISTVSLIAIGAIAGLVFDSAEFYVAMVCAAIGTGATRPLFLEGCLAFGAETSPAPDETLPPIPGT